jgi:acyl-CoA reductase-like NAD-dependent aldehyde dehydrogenase
LAALIYSEAAAEAYLVQHPGVDKVAFTGSTAAGG